MATGSMHHAGKRLGFIPAPLAPMLSVHKHFPSIDLEMERRWGLMEAQISYVSGLVSTEAGAAAAAVRCSALGFAFGMLPAALP